MAAMTLPLIFWAFSMNSDRRLSTTSSTPPNSPALTMLINSRLKTLGCWARPSEKVLPPSIDTASSPIIDLRVGFRSCFSSTRKPRSRGSPASTSVANWRVNVVRTLDFTRPLRPGILMLRLTLKPLPLPLPLGLAPVLGAGPAFLSDLSLAFSTSTILVDLQVGSHNDQHRALVMETDGASASPAVASKFSRRDDEAEPVRSAAKPRIQRDEPTTQQPRKRQVFGVVGLRPAELAREPPGRHRQPIQSPLDNPQLERKSVGWSN